MKPRRLSITILSFSAIYMILTVRGGGGVRERRQSTCTLQVNGKRISSPNHPDAYPSNGRCEYTIRADAGCKIRLRFSHFALENPDFVCYDWLRVYDGETLLGEFCGTDRPDDFTSSGSIMKLDFSSDSTGQYSGFAVKYKIVSCDLCQPNPCLNKGVCAIVGDRFRCRCRSGYIGELCEERHPCEKLKCPATEICTEAGGEYECTCKDGYERIDRSCVWNPCLQKKCSVHEKCIVVGNKASCTCRDGFKRNDDDICAKDCSHCLHRSLPEGVVITNRTGVRTGDKITYGCGLDFNQTKAGVSKDVCRLNGVWSESSSSSLPSCERECTKCYCNVKGFHRNERIINGMDASIEDFSWTVHVVIGSPHGENFCGGVLVHERFVLTAAHCVNFDGDLIDSERLYVHLGLTDRGKKHELGVECRGVANIFTHPNFAYESGRNCPSINDIAVLELDRPAYTTSRIGTVCLGSSRTPTENCKVSGWGLTDPHNSYGSPKLQEASLGIVNSTNCQSILRSLSSRCEEVEILDSKLCAGGSDRKDACRGDSGGPLVCYDRNKRNPVGKPGRYYLVGIVSWGIGCGDGPGVYTRISSYRNWIKSHWK